jgi:hypothetical protein
MLEAIFRGSSRVRVRQRSFHDEEDFRAWCRELEWLAEPIVLVVASHASPEGLTCRGGRIPPAAIAEALAAIPSLRLVHFSACGAMGGGIPEAILEARGAEGALEGVSGYDDTVDWMASALTEFTYLELVLNRGLAPAEAARQVLELVRFAGAEGVAGASIPPARFRYVPRAAGSASD